MALRSETGIYQLLFNQERAAVFDYSKPYFSDAIQIVTLKEHTFPFSTLQDLQGKRMGGISWASYGQKVDQPIAQAAGCDLALAIAMEALSCAANGTALSPCRYRWRETCCTRPV